VFQYILLAVWLIDCMADWLIYLVDTLVTPTCSCCLQGSKEKHFLHDWQAERRQQSSGTSERKSGSPSKISFLTSTPA